MHDLQCNLSDSFLMTAFSFQWCHIAYRTLSKLLGLASFAPAIWTHWICLMLPNVLGLLVIFVCWLCQQMVLPQMCFSLPQFPSCVPPPTWWTPFFFLWRLCSIITFHWRYHPKLSFCSPHTSLRRIGALYLFWNLKSSIWKSLPMIPIVSFPLYKWMCLLFIKGLSLTVLGIPFLLPSQKL